MLFCGCMIRLLAHPLPLYPVSKFSLSQSCSVSPVELTYGRGVGGDGQGAKSFDHEKAWSSASYSIVNTLWFIKAVASLVFKLKIL
jgi:hypothetical protein